MGDRLKQEKERRRAWLHVDQALRNVDLIVWLQHEIFVGVALFNDPLEVDDEILSIFSCDANFTFVRKIAEAAGADYCLADGINLIGRNYLRTLPLHRTVNIYF